MEVTPSELLWPQACQPGPSTVQTHSSQCLTPSCSPFSSSTAHPPQEPGCNQLLWGSLTPRNKSYKQEGLGFGQVKSPQSRTRKRLQSLPTPVPAVAARATLESVLEPTQGPGTNKPLPLLPAQSLGENRGSQGSTQ